MCSRTLDIRAWVVFEDPADCDNIQILGASSAAPKVFTGQRLRGHVYVSQSQRCVFDTVQITLKGETPEPEVKYFYRLNYLVGTVENVVRLPNGDFWKTKKPVREIPQFS